MAARVVVVRSWPHVPRSPVCYRGEEPFRLGDGDALSVPWRRGWTDAVGLPPRQGRHGRWLGRHTAMPAHPDHQGERRSLSP